MQIYDFIGIDHQLISGVKNPYLNLIGTCTKRDAIFQVLEDGEEIEYKTFEVNKENGFYIQAKLRADSKFIKVYILDGDKRYLIFSSKMSVFNRLGHKIEVTSSNIYYMIKSIFGCLGKGLPIIWKKHHLLVPFKYWSKYFNTYKDKVKTVYNKSLEEANVFDF